jgi:hypothetical protein
VNRDSEKVQAVDFGAGEIERGIEQEFSSVLVKPFTLE